MSKAPRSRQDRLDRVQSAVDERRPEGALPLLTQIKTRPPRSAMLGNVRADHGQKPLEEGGRDYPLKLGPELGLARSGLTWFWNDLDELAGLADPRALELRAMKATLAKIGQSRDDWRRQAEVRRLWQW